jgi:membrane associated rhomboid family serine protease
MPERRTPWVLYAVIAANVAMFAVEVAAGANPLQPTPQDVLGLGGNLGLYTLRGEWWRLGSSMFLHFGVLHIALNMLCLWQARDVEFAFGRVGFVVIYLLSGLAGGIAALLVTPDGVIAGASGCVFGVYGAIGAKLVMHREQFDPAAWQKTMQRLGTFLGLNLVIGLSSSSISLSAHVGGLAVGAAAGVALLAGAHAEQQRTRRTLAIALIGLAVIAGALLAMKPPATYAALDDFYAAEGTAVAANLEANRRLAAGEIHEPEYLAAIDRDVVAPYRRARDELRAAGEPPERLRPLFTKLDALLTARLDMWDVRHAAAAEADPTKHAELMERYTQAAKQANDLANDVTAEVQRLGK